MTAGFRGTARITAPTNLFACLVVRHSRNVRAFLGPPAWLGVLAGWNARNDT